MSRSLVLARLAGLALAASLAGCGASNAASSTGGGGAATVAPDLSGRYASSCLGPSNGSYAKLGFDLGGSTWKLDYDLYGDAACTVALGTVHIEGPYELDRPSSVVPGAWEARFGFTTKTVTPHAQPFADFLASAKGCGGGSFPLEKATDVFEKGCAGIGMYPRASCSADYDVVKLDGDVLHFGQRPADNDMCTPDKRPTSLNPAGDTRK